MRNTFWVGVVGSLIVALGFALAANKPRTCAQEFTSGYSVGVEDTTAAFQETFK